MQTLGGVLVSSVFLCRAPAPLVVFPAVGVVALEQLQHAETVVGIGQFGVQLDRLGKLFAGVIEYRAAVFSLTPRMLPKFW